jgi:hypothetical protein
MGQIVLYRMIYLTGPVLSWSLRLAQGRMGLGFEYPQETLLRFIDDCAAERPNLVPEIQKCIDKKEYEPNAEMRRTTLLWEEGMHRAIEIYDQERSSLRTFLEDS